VLFYAVALGRYTQQEVATSAHDVIPQTSNTGGSLASRPQAQLEAAKRQHEDHLMHQLHTHAVQYAAADAQAVAGAWARVIFGEAAQQRA